MTTTDAAKSKPGLLEAVESMTGYESDDVAKHFGESFDDMDSSRSLRATLYVLRKRKDDTATWDGVMSMTLKAVKAEFSDFDKDGQSEGK